MPNSSRHKNTSTKRKRSVLLESLMQIFESEINLVRIKFFILFDIAKNTEYRERQLFINPY